jgi:hypothetical protein
MLADEIVICPQTSQYAGPGELLTCSETGEQGVPDVFVKSSISSKLYLRKNTKSLPNGHVVGKTETVVCFWSRKYFRASDTAICKLCGLEFEKSLLNASGEFRILRKALDGEATGDDFPDDMFLARLSPKNFSGIKGF